MTELKLEHMHEDLESVKRDLELIKNILVEEGDLTEDAKKKLGQARKTPISAYKKLE